MPEPRTATVWHIGAWNRNVGDWALAYQTHRLLREQSRPRGLLPSYYMVDSQRTVFHRALIDQLNEEADLVLIGGGGLIFHRPEDQSVSGWSFNVTLDELDRIRRPIVVYGIGYNKFRFDPGAFPEVTGRHLRCLQERAALFSVRNHGTRRVLVEEYGLDADRIDVIPDAGICLYDRPIEIPARRPGGPLIALNWAGDRPHFRYPPPAEDNARHFLAAVRSALLRCMRELGAQVMFLPHLLHVDSDMFDAFAAGFPPGSIFSTHRELSFLYPPPGEMLYPHVPFFTNLYRQADLALGMRFHACVLAFGAGTRFLRIGSHPKLEYFVRDVAVPDHAVPLVDRDGESADRVFERIQSCLDDAEYAPRLKQSLNDQLGILRAFNNRVLDVLERAELRGGSYG
jgi:hypothetical protein